MFVVWGPFYKSLMTAGYATFECLASQWILYVLSDIISCCSVDARCTVDSIVHQVTHPLFRSFYAHAHPVDWSSRV